MNDPKKEERLRVLFAGLQGPKADDALAGLRLELTDAQILEEFAARNKALKDPKKALPTAFINSVPFTEVKAKAIDWLYEGYLPRGMLVTIFAPKGRGKTKIVDFLSACTTTGKGWPGGAKTEPAVVLRFNMEDPEEQILRPSLQAAGADLNLVRFVERTATSIYKNGEVPEPVDFSRQSMVDALHKHIEDYCAKLVVIEPVNNYKGAAKANSEDDMRPIFTAIAGVAISTGACIVAINHANKKKDVDVLEKSLGAGSSTAVARANFFLEKNPDVPEERILSNAGSNIPIGKSLVFVIESAPTFVADGIELRDIGIARFVRHDEITSDDLLDRVNTTKKSESDAIERFLRDLLASGEEVPTEKIKALAFSENKDWKWGTIRQVFARRKIGESSGNGAKTKWRKHDAERKNDSLF